MIQIITKNAFMYKDKFINKEIIVSSFDEYKSFDLYDVNIINLSSNDLWESNASNGEYLNDKCDLSTIKNSINTSNAKVLIFFPQNCFFRYDYSIYNKAFKKAQQLKSIKEKTKDFLTKYIYEPLPKFDYEKGITKIDGVNYTSDFYFDEENGMILSEKSKKNNTMSLSDKVVITSLSIFETPIDKDIEKKLFVILNRIGFLTKNEEIPKWIENISFHDDCVYKENIEKCSNEIDKLNLIINENKEKLNNNSKYKSILYSSGNFLSEQINKMLKEIFDLSDEFVDVYEEDFNFKAGNVTFIVETKGLNNEVSGQNVSDAYNHLIIYDDNLENHNIVEETKCLFFVANERLKDPNERSKVKERQVTIAKRNKTLIIETTTFYKLFDDFIKKEINVNEILEMFKNNTGLLEYKNNQD